LSVERGSTFASRGDGLKRTAPRKPSRSSFTPASPQQREKIARLAALGSIIDGAGPCDPSHLWPRGKGGCDHEDCVVPLTREQHRAFDDGKLDILSSLIDRQCWAELAHMIEAHHVDPISLLQQLTNERWAPEGATAAMVLAGARALEAHGEAVEQLAMDEVAQIVLVAALGEIRTPEAGAGREPS
jgi:hypothetical protein